MKSGVHIHYAILGNLKTYFEEHSLKFASYPLIIALFLLLETQRVLLHGLGVDQGSDDTGIAEKKLIFKTDLIDAVLNISDPLSSLYKSRKDMENYRKLKKKKWRLLRDRPEALLQYVDAVLAFYVLHQADNVVAGNTPAKITKLTTKRDLFNPYANLPNKTKKLKSGITSKINAIDVEVVEILKNQLDGAMVAIKDDELQLFNDYSLIVEPIREGIHSHHVTIAKAIVKLYIIHDLTDEPIEFVQIKFPGIKGTKITNSEGMIVANLPLGFRECKIAFIDFIAQTISFTLTAEGYVLTVRLVPVGV